MIAWCRCLAPVFCHIYNCMHLMIFRNIYTLFPVFTFWHWYSISFLFSKTLCHTPEKPVWGSHTCRSAFPYGLFRMPEKPFSCIWKGHIHWWYVQSANIQRVVNVAKIAHIAVLIGSGLIIRDSQRLYIVCIFTFFPLVFSDRSQMFMSDCPADYVRIPAYSTRHTLPLCIHMFLW